VAYVEYYQRKNRVVQIPFVDWISPVFKEQRHDGTLKTVTVYAKKARGAMIRYALQNKATKPADLLGFADLGWEATSEPPESGNWLFSRPADASK